MLRNASSYYPWESDKNGKSGGSQSLLGVSMVAGSETIFDIAFERTDNGQEYAVDVSECSPHPTPQGLLPTRKGRVAHSVCTLHRPRGAWMDG